MLLGIAHRRRETDPRGYARFLKLAAAEGNALAIIDRCQLLIDKHYSAPDQAAAARGAVEADTSAAAAAATGSSESPAKRKAIAILEGLLADKDSFDDPTVFAARKLILMANNRNIYILIKGITDRETGAQQRKALIVAGIADVQDIDSLHIIYKILDENKLLLQQGHQGGRMRLGRQYGELPAVIKAIQAQAVRIAEACDMISDKDDVKFSSIFINRYTDRALKKRYTELRAAKPAAADDEQTTAVPDTP